MRVARVEKDVWVAWFPKFPQRASVAGTSSQAINLLWNECTSLPVASNGAYAVRELEGFTVVREDVYMGIGADFNQACRDLVMNHPQMVNAMMPTTTIFERCGHDVRITKPGGTTIYTSPLSPIKQGLDYSVIAQAEPPSIEERLSALEARLQLLIENSRL